MAGLDIRSSSSMTTIKKAKSGRQSYITAAVLVGILLVSACVLLFTNQDGEAVVEGGSGASPNLRSLTDVAAGENGGDTEEGRLITFELGNLDGKEGEVESITIRTRPSWAPIGVERFHELVDNGFFDGCRFFRVVPNFIVQFGINGDPVVQSEWRGKSLQDDPVTTSNTRGTVTFATSGPNTRTSQMFINTNRLGNKYLDNQGFAPIGEVVEGMEHVDRINPEYREKPSQGKIQNQGNAYLNEYFPRLSYIVSAKGAE